MHHVPQAGLTALAVAGPVVQRGVKPHRGELEELGHVSVRYGSRQGGWGHAVCIGEISIGPGSKESLNYLSKTRVCENSTEERRVPMLVWFVNACSPL